MPPIIKFHTFCSRNFLPGAVRGAPDDGGQVVRRDEGLQYFLDQVQARLGDGLGSVSRQVRAQGAGVGHVVHAHQEPG
ncbi:MAG: hypothetical protein ACE5LU_13410 [Anaerolineae bacterium]